uniref:Cell morphogenesis protein C-terminal domain-containing protein n=1 Tax=Spongospora subterranea TaxID=70186 RepID=A0A0H5QL22_9EUKA|eukprot:CRZ02815.1 hypothetical protein [Spongospora subterranea]
MEYLIGHGSCSSPRNCLLEEDPGVFNSLTGFLLGALDADSSDIYRLVGLIHNYSTALVLIMESFRSHPNLDNIVDGHGHLRLFTKQHRQRALLLLKQYRDLDLDQNERCVQAASKLLMLGPVLTTTTMKSNDELLMWIFQFASSSILSRLMNYQWLALYPLYLLHLFDFPNILPAVADNIRTQSQLPKKHVGLLVTIMFSVIVSNTGDCVDHATSILNSLSRLFGATRTYNRAALHSTFLNVRLVAAISVAEAFANDLPREFHGDVAMSLLHRQKLFPRPCPFMAIWLPGIPSTEMPQFLDALTAYEERDENLAQIWIDLVHYRHESFSLILAAAVKRPSMLIAMFHAASNNQKEAFFDFLLVPVFCRISGTHSATTLPDSFSISLLIELLYIDGAIKLLTDAQLAAILFWVAVGDHASIARRLEIILDGKRTQIINQAENAWSILEHRIGATLIHCIGQHSLTYLSKHLQSEQCVVQSLRILLHRDAFTPSLDTIRGLLWCLLSFLDNMQYCKSDSIQFPVQLLQILGKSVNNETRSLLIRASVAILHCDNPLLYGQSLHILNECLQAVEREPQNFEHQYLLTVQPLLVYGFTNKVTEVASQDVLLQLSRAASNHLLGNGGEQCVAAIIYLLPWVISSYTSLKDQLIVDRIVFVMSKIAKLLSKSHRALAEIFMCELQNIESLSKNQQSFPHDSALFLTTVCRELIACCRGQTALFAEILYVMLQRGNDLHKSALFRISAAFLQHDYAYEFIDDFCDVIAFAKGLLSKETSTVSEDMMAGAMDVISSAIDVYTSVTSMTHKKSVMENRFFSSHSFEKALLELHKLMESECCLDSSKLFSK